jgi:hypothetical protein
MHYRYLEDPWDMQGLRDAVRLCVRLLEDPALQAILDYRVSPTDADLASDAATDQSLLHNVTSSYHIAGTCQMGPASAPMVIVDSWCRVHELAGLRVADASIMPDVVRANTNVTTMMIAERCADFIKAGQETNRQRTALPAQMLPLLWDCPLLTRIGGRRILVWDHCEEKSVALRDPGAGRPQGCLEAGTVEGSAAGPSSPVHGWPRFACYRTQ